MIDFYVQFDDESLEDTIKAHSYIAYATITDAVLDLAVQPGAPVISSSLATSTFKVVDQHGRVYYQGKAKLIGAA